MRVAELSRRTGVSVASIKYYLREGLLPPGERTSPNQASYGEEHVRRLRLVRALIDVGGLSVAGTRDVLAAVDADDVALHHVLGATQDALLGEPAATDDDATERAGKLLDDLVARRGWRVTPTNPGRRAVVEILATSERLGTDVLAGLLDTYAETLEPLARREVGAVVARSDREDVVESAVLGTVLGAGLISALRTMAHESASAELASGAAPPPEG
ncbi:MerR family transcriptional regulator [Actinomycetospora cinnamomea]|uniref:DNA-binding transcriptional MerR regulator n=1 Tax=Actinomycetospora cinnamomea TaxID=663609 RepID=A0A2U1FCV5_9PSEU|nr:MerR family transcriptional regulator [Actinomycetospora cinnamomea]PVZ09998.1 DNA-binding transcriptional MerR regulator [Actinomycetospora cinnamomea]